MCLIMIADSKCVNHQLDIRIGIHVARLRILDAVLPSVLQVTHDVVISLLCRWIVDIVLERVGVNKSVIEHQVSE